MPVTDDARFKPPPLPTPEPGSGSRELGTIDGKYLLIREIGSGSAATVYEAEHLVVGKRVALKVLHTSTADEIMRERFVGEARAAAQIAHANVVDIYDLGVSDRGIPYLVMELLHGETLEQVLYRRRTISPTEACEIMTQVLAGLGAAHALGIVHRDLKPANIIVTYPRPDAPLVKVLDFGIAKGVLGGAAESDEGLVGTPVYMAPEQALAGEVDARADVYAAGVILYEMLAGEPPFAGSAAQVIAKVIGGQWKPLSAINPAVPRLLVLAIARAMAKNPEERIPTAHDFALHLGPYLSHPPPHSVPMGSASGDAFLLVSNQNAEIKLVDSNRSPLPRDFPSIHLAKVDGKPRGEPLADAVLKSPVIPRAPTAPKIHLSGGDVETWSNAPAAPEPKDHPNSGSRGRAVMDVLFLSRSPGERRSSRPVSPWRIAAWATVFGVGIGALIAWLYHLSLAAS